MLWSHGQSAVPGLRLYRDVQLKLAIGPENELVDAVITGIDTYRDGGSMDVNYILNGERGKLFIPKHTAKPTDTYQGKTIELEKLI